MYDILAYLFEQYYSPEDCPDASTLARRLAAAGFEGSEIDEALDWLNELAQLDADELEHPSEDTVRILHPREAARMSDEAQAFFHYLAGSGALTVSQREVLLDWLIRHGPARVDEEAMKRVALMLLWRQGDDLANLLIEEILYSGEPAVMH